MRKLTPLSGRRIFISRGIKEEMECGLVVPAKFLTGSSLGTDDLGRTVIIRDGSGYDAGDGQKIVEEQDIIAVVKGGKIYPQEGWLLGRKCEDPQDDSGLVSLKERENRFVEVLAGGGRFGVEDRNGWLAYVSETASPQKIEDCEDDWLVPRDGIKFFYKGEQV